jgi:uncharacterized membrane protein YqaE (UPF0057 family)
MKKNMYILVSGLIAVTFLFGSCKSLTNLSIEKRQHRGGYYVDWGNGKVKTDPVKNTSAKAKQSKETPKTSATAQQAKPVSKTVSATTEQKKSTTAEATVTNAEPKRVHSTSTFKVKEEAVAQRESSSKKTMSSFSYSFSDSDKSSSSETPTWVLAVLCVLLPPLAVFLHLGIGTEFWISLILTLIFWIPGVIYAFVVIF